MKRRIFMDYEESYFSDVTATPWKWCCYNDEVGPSADTLDDYALWSEYQDALAKLGELQKRVGESAVHERATDVEIEIYEAREAAMQDYCDSACVGDMGGDTSAPREQFERTEAELSERALAHAIERSK